MGYKEDCSTVAKRAKLSERVLALAKTNDIEVSQLVIKDRELSIILAWGDYYVSMCFDGGSHVGAYVAPWNAVLHSDAKFPHYFVAGSVNMSHFRKATTVEYTFPEFLDAIFDGFAALKKLSE